MIAVYIGLMIHIQLEKNDTAQFLWEARGRGTLCAFFCVGFWTLLQGRGSTKGEGRSSMRIYCFCSHIYYLWSMLFGKHLFSLVRPGRHFRLSLKTYQNWSYTNQLFYRLIELREEEITGLNHAFVYISRRCLSLNIRRMKVMFYRE